MVHDGRWSELELLLGEGSMLAAVGIDGEAVQRYAAEIRKVNWSSDAGRAGSGNMCLNAPSNQRESTA